MQAVVCDGPGRLRLAADIPKPEADAGKVLVRVDAVALNHSDWKMADFSAKVGAISGFDMAGTVVETSGGISGQEKSLSVGDTVLGVTGIHGGAFAEYALVDSDFMVRVPPGMSQTDAATFGVGLVTMGLALYSSEFLGLAWPSTTADNIAATATTTTTTMQRLVTPRGWGGSSSDDEDDDVQGISSSKTPVLVYGASSATGTLALQLLRSSGYEALAVCSPRNFRLVQSRGAAKCFDYHSSACAAQIKQYTKNRLALVLDCITTASSMKLAYDAMGAGGGKYVSLDPFSARVQRTRADIKAAFCYALTAFGLPIELDGAFARPANLNDRKVVVKFMKTAETLIAQGQLEPHPGALQPDGLGGITDAIDLLRRGEVSGQKLVFKVA